MGYVYVCACIHIYSLNIVCLAKLPFIVHLVAIYLMLLKGMGYVSLCVYVCIHVYIVPSQAPFYSSPCSYITDVADRNGVSMWFFVCVYMHTCIH
jgi:hypothetical protein